MTDREAMLILAEPVPEPFHQVLPSAADKARWQAWHDRYIAAVAHARSTLA